MAEWGKLYGSLHGSAEWRAATKGARSLWTTALSWCIDQETQDGDIPAHMLRTLDGTAPEAACLVKVGLWDAIDGGWHIHNYERRQRTKDKIRADRDADAERQRRWRESQASRRDRSVTDGVSHAAREEESREEEKKTPNGVSAAADADGFEAFWATYPRRDDRGHALKAYRSALRKTDAATLHAGAEAFASQVVRERRERKFIPLAATWLNGERWGDDLPGAGHSEPDPLGREPNVTDLRLAGLLP